MTRIWMMYNTAATAAYLLRSLNLTHWNLYGQEADIYNNNLVENLMGNISSMVFLMRGLTGTSLISHLHRVAYDYKTVSTCIQDTLLPSTVT